MLDSRHLLLKGWGVGGGELLQVKVNNIELYILVI